jgi:hypothetical protein
MADHRRAGLCLNCNEQFTRGHKCKQLFKITVMNDYSLDDLGDVAPNLMMLINSSKSTIPGSRTMLLIRILIDIGATHNNIGATFAKLAGIKDHRINTTIQMGNGSYVTCHKACFNTCIFINNEIFYIDAFLVDLNSDNNIILETQWPATLGPVLWDFNTLQMSFTLNGAG